MQIFVECNSLESFDALATSSHNIGTERRREISQMGHKISMLSESTFKVR